MRKALQAFLALGFAGFVTTILGMARAKWIAMELGPLGVATLSQLFGYSQLAAGVAALGIGAGVVREVALARRAGGDAHVWAVVGTATRLTALPAVALTLVAVGWPALVAAALLGDPTQAPLVRMAGLSIAPLVLVSLVQSTLYGLGEYRRVAHVTVWTNAVGLGLLLGLVSCCGTWGAVFQGVLLASLQLLACGWHLLSVVGWPAKAQPDGSGRSSLVTYGLLYLAIAAIQQGGILYVRREVLTTVGGVEAGVFTAVWGISWTYLALVVGSLQPYYLSEISGEGSSSSRSKCMSDVLRVLSAVQTPATLCAITLSAFLLQTLYTSQFRVGSGLLRLLALGDLLMAASWAVFVPLLAAKRLAWAFVIECTFWIVFVALTTLLLPRGLAGVFEACLWARVAQLVVAAVIFRAVLEFALPVRGVAAIVAAGCFVASVYAVRETGMSPAGFIAMFGCGGLWLVATVSVAEARAAFGRFRASLERN